MNSIFFIILLIFSLTILVYSSSAFLFFIGLHRRKEGNNTTLNQISVIIAARNEQNNLPHLLESLMRQDYPDHLHEIIVVDDQSTDRTPEILKNYADRCEQLRCLRVKETPPDYSPKKYALNLGIEASSGSIILCVDADCVVKPTWISAMNSYFIESVGMVVGFSGIEVNNASSLFDRWQALDYLALMAANEGALNLGIPLSASGQNLGFTREAFDSIGGYQHIAGRATGDDVLLLQLIRKNTDYQIRFASTEDAYNVTWPEPTLSRLLHQRIRWASDGPIQLIMDPLFFLYLLMVLLMYLALGCGTIYAIITPAFIPVLLGGLATKLTGEFLVLSRATKLYQRHNLLPLFPLWTFSQIPYIILAGVGSLFFDYTWKGRDRSVNPTEPPLKGEGSV